MTRIRDSDLDLLDVVEAIMTNRSVDIDALGLDPELRREIVACLPARKRQRKPNRPSIKTMIEQAEKAGKPLASITLADGTKLDFGKPLAEPENPWLADLRKETRQ